MPAYLYGLCGQKAPGYKQRVICAQGNEQVARAPEGRLGGKLSLVIALYLGLRTLKGGFQASIGLHDVWSRHSETCAISVGRARVIA